MEHVGGVPGVDGRQAPVVALRHGRQHLDHLRAEHLADQDAGRVVPAGAADQFGDADAAVAVRVGQHLLELHHVGVQLRVPAQAQLQGPFDGDDPLPGLNAIDQRAEQARFSRVSRSRDDDVCPGQDGGPQERRGLLVDGAEADQVGQEHLREPVAAHRHHRPFGRGHHRGQPGPVGQPQVQLRVGGGERPGVQARVPGEGLHHPDQVVVGGGDRPAPDLAAVVGVGHPHLVAAVDVDVFHLPVAEQFVQLGPRPVHGGVHGGNQPAVVPGVGQVPALALISSWVCRSTACRIRLSATCRSSSASSSRCPAASRSCFTVVIRSATLACSRRTRV